MSDRKRILHCLKRIAHMLGLLKEEMDELFDALEIKEEEKDG